MDKFIAHILVVDDDNGIRSLVKKYLNENDYLVTTSQSAEDANEKIKLITDDPAAIVDVPHFCNEQGYQITESLQENGHDLFIIKC